jgi:hypothetical protein
MTDYTVTISGEEREDGEEPCTYVVSASSPAEAAQKALIFHGPAFGLALEGIVPGVPPEDCGYHWNDLRTQMAHTPGPWHCHYLGEIAEQDVDGCLATGITTASIDEYNKEGDRGDLIAWVPHDRNEEANAALIAAAPELLAALKEMVAMVEAEYSGFDAVPEWQAATAAINKAEEKVK